MIKSAKCGEVTTVVSNAAPPVSRISFKQVGIFWNTAEEDGSHHWLNAVHIYIGKKASVTHCYNRAQVFAKPGEVLARGKREEKEEFETQLPSFRDHNNQKSAKDIF